MTSYSFRFADIEILRYEVQGWEQLPLPTKRYLYHLSEAALWGRDIPFAQHHPRALQVRHLMDALVENEQSRPGADYSSLCEYAYRVAFSSGIHHHYSERKFVPACPEEYLLAAAQRLSSEVQQRFTDAGINLVELIRFCYDDTDLYRRAHGEESTLIERSSVAFYGPDLTTAEAQEYYEHLAETGGIKLAPGLNTRLVRSSDGSPVEEVAYVHGLYGPALQAIVRHLEAARECAPTLQAAELLSHLISYYNTGELNAFYDFSVAWVQSGYPAGTDYINGFIETYTDPLGLKGSWESVVQLVDTAETQRTQLIAQHASELERRSPIAEEYKKGNINGVSATAIEVLMLGGDAYPASPLGINLPNDEGIRAEIGSKSVTLTNISRAVEKASAGSGFIEAFYLGSEVQQRIREYGALTSMLHTDLHECLGHGSGRLLSGVTGDALGPYDSAIEEARADLNALYFIADPALVTWGLLPHPEAYKAEYDRFLTNGAISQLARLEDGAPLCQAHMQDRALISRWLLAHADSSTLRWVEQEGHCYIAIHDYERLRSYIGELLRIVQEVKSTGDIDTARHLIETYATHVDPATYASATQRYRALGLPPYRGFINPRLTPIHDSNGKIIDVSMDYNESYPEQILRYSREYSTLPLSTSHAPLHPDGRWRDILNTLRRQLRRSMDGVVAESMRAKGVHYGINFGVTLPRLQQLATSLPHSSDLARLMWNKDVREMKLLATMIFPLDELTVDEAYQLCLTSPHVEVSEQLVLHLLQHHPAAEHLLLRLWRHHNDYTEQATIIPYILMTRLLMGHSKGYQLHPLLLQQASLHFDTPAGSLTLYLLNALRRLADYDERGHRLVREWCDSQPPHLTSPLLTAVRDHLVS